MTLNGYFILNRFRACRFSLLQIAQVDDIISNLGRLITHVLCDFTNGCLAYQFHVDRRFVQIYFSELKITTIEAEEAYTELALLCDIGGALGLILGSTMLTFCEFGDFFITMIITWLKVRASTAIVNK